MGKRVTAPLKRGTSHGLSRSGRSPAVVGAQLGGLAHLGPEVAVLLRKAGIRTRAELEETGAVGAYVVACRKGLQPTLSFLYALEGALRGVAWASLPYHVRASLTLEADAILHSERRR